MKFLLTYSGALSPTQRRTKGAKKEPLAEQRWRIRKAIHDQLSKLWRVDRTLAEWKTPRSEFNNQRPAHDNIARWASGDEPEPLCDLLAEMHERDGRRFVPLATRHFHLMVSLDILFLRRDQPGSAVHNGDIDNRIKTLVDCLRMPAKGAEMEGAEKEFQAEEPIYCLMEDDDQIFKISVETARLLRPSKSKDTDADVDLVIRVDVRPYLVTQDGTAFLG